MKKIDKKIWHKVENRLLSSSLVGSDVYCHIPLCIGYGEAPSDKNILALTEDLERREYEFTIYLCPKNNELLEQWMENSNAAKNLATRTVLIDEWRGNAIWQQASQRYDNFFSSSELGMEAKNQLKIDAETYCRRHANALPNEVMRHFYNEIKDCLSWMRRLDDDINNKVKINVLLYPNRLVKSLHQAFKHADTIGYERNSIIHVQPKYLISPDIINHADSNEFNKLIIWLLDSGVDAKAVGRLIDGFLNGEEVI